MAERLENMMEDLMVIQKNQMTADELVKARLVKNENLILGLAKKYEGQDIRLVNVEDEIENLKLNEEITHEQNREIKQFAHSRVNKMLNYPAEAKYFQTFIMNLYGYLRRNSQLGNPIAITRKKHYDTVMKGIESWRPNIQELKDRKDKRDKLQEEGKSWM